MKSSAHEISQLGLAFRSLGDIERNKIYHEKALYLDSNNWGIQTNYALALQDLGFDQEALNIYKALSRKTPHHPVVTVNWAMSSLRHQPSHEGFHLFLSRWQIPSWPQKKYDLPVQHWLDSQKIFNRLLVMPDQGYGDTMFSFPFVYWLAKKYPGRVHLLVKPIMERLAKKIFEGLQIDISQVANGQYDGWLTGLDIPGVFADAAHHYHSCRNLIALNFKKRHGSTIGLVWRGNPDFQDEAWRMVPYKDLLKNISSKSSDIDLMIFHQDLNLEETQAINETRQPWQASHGDWLDTAEKLLQVKQLIGSDTGVIHLAGLLGVPVQLLLYKTYGWLWPRVKNQSYWYPSVKIIQQSKLLAWDEPIDAISLN